MPDHVVKKGLDIPIAGAASGEPITLDAPATVAYSPIEFKGIVPRLSVREGDAVQRGTPLFHAKANHDMQFLSPVAGTVKEIRRGHRRVITDLVVEVGGDEAVTYPSIDPATADAETIRSALQKRGQWAAFRTRPLDNIPKSDAQPQAIVVSATETGPLMPGADVLLGAGDKEHLQAGLTALSKLAKVYLAVPKGSHPALQGLTGVETHGFSGPHPAGDPSLQVNLLTPPKGTGQVWYCRAWDVVEMGKVLVTGQFSGERVYAAVGAGVAQPRYVRTLMGAPLQHIVGATKGEALRWIRGSVLTGESVGGDRWVSHFARGVHVLPDEVESDLFGWALPMFGTWSFHKTFLKAFTGSGGAVDLRPGIFGGERAMVPIGVYGKVVATPDVLPEFLFKSIVANDLEEAIQLGLLDITAEEAALCTYICPSKIEFDELLKKGLALYEKEAS
ncbi:MAG: NADH:ubiquinone reductase (Na(+)-transporting) subunit A [Alphaproteobacteria bacterium]|nr:NADH:ubiquinone reductase (Na(+)-transporting) subunit A [Alphaproteobacteria bacterium]